MTTSSPAGPPDSMREHVVAAAHAMLKGDWKSCKDYILSIKAWDLFLNVDQLKEMLARYMYMYMYMYMSCHVMAFSLCAVAENLYYMYIAGYT